MHVGILTYQTGHLKTWQITQRILAKGYRVTLFAFPFKKRPASIQMPDEPKRFPDRPFQLIDIDVEQFCRYYGVGYQVVDDWSKASASAFGARGDHGSPDVFLHCFAKIIPEHFIRDRIILNAHPGLLPHNRGVDALKWSLLKPWPVGVTLHIIDEEIDRGEILCRARVPILPVDRLSDVCRRVYEMELDLMGNFEHHLVNRNRGWHVGDDYPCSHEKIPLAKDLQLESIFDSNRKEIVRLSKDRTFLPHEADMAIDGRFLHQGDSDDG